MTKNLIIWDWNGTLLDDTALCVRAINAVLQRFDKPQVSIAQFQEHYTIPMIATYEALGFTLDEIMTSRLEIWQLWRSVYDAASTEIPLRSGAQEALTALRRHGVRNVVLSNHLLEDINAHAARLGINEHFSAVLANTDLEATTMNRRAKSDRLREYMERERSSGAVVVGDTVEEIEIGRALGQTTIALTGGTCSQNRLESAKPDFLIHDLGEMPAIVDKVFQTQGHLRMRASP